MAEVVMVSVTVALALGWKPLSSGEGLLPLGHVPMGQNTWRGKEMQAGSLMRT